MLHAGLDLGRRRLDVCWVDDGGELVEHFAAPPDTDGLRGLVDRLGDRPVRAVIESMTGARFVHDTLEELGGRCSSPMPHLGDVEPALCCVAWSQSSPSGPWIFRIRGADRTMGSHVARS